MVGVVSLDLVAFPMRTTSPADRGRADARRGELFHAFYGRCPVACNGEGDHLVACPTTWWEIVAGGEECLVVGDGGRRYAERFEGPRVIVPTRRSPPERDLAGAARPRPGGAR